MLAEIYMLYGVKIISNFVCRMSINLFRSMKKIMIDEASFIYLFFFLIVSTMLSFDQFLGRRVANVDLKFSV